MSLLSVPSKRPPTSYTRARVLISSYTRRVGWGGVADIARKGPCAPEEKIARDKRCRKSNDRRNDWCSAKVLYFVCLQVLITAPARRLLKKVIFCFVSRSFCTHNGGFAKQLCFIACCGIVFLFLSLRIKSQWVFRSRIFTKLNVLDLIASAGLLRTAFLFFLRHEIVFCMINFWFWVPPAPSQAWHFNYDLK